MTPSEAEALEAVRTIIRYLGDDPEREGLIDTPRRVIKSWGTLYGGYDKNIEEVAATNFSSDGYDQMVILKDIEFWSTCEHHMLPFYGSVSVGYLPNAQGRVLGVSKLARIVEMYARRLQIQERLTNQIAEAIVACIDCDGVGVVTRAKHLCMVARGVEKRQSDMVTSAMIGTIRQSPATRNEFLTLIGER